MTNLNVNIIFLFPKIKLNDIFSTSWLIANLNFLLIGKVKIAGYF